VNAQRLLVPALVSLGLCGCGGGGGGGGSGDASTPNRPPVITGLAHTIAEDLDLAATVSASDPEGAAVTFARTAEPTHGNLTQFAANGAFTYRPDPDFFGNDSFGVAATDSAGNRVTATVAITVTAVNDAPRGNAVTVGAQEDTPSSGQVAASDPEGDPITFAKIADGGKGVVTVAANGAFTYAPALNANGADTFEIEARDAGNAVSRITVNVAIAPVSDPLAIRNDYLSVPAGNPVVLDVLANDSNPDGEELTLTAVPNTLYFGQSAAVVNGHIEVTMPPNFVGFARIDYHAENSAGDGGTATAVFFVDTQPFRAVYVSNEETGRNNAYVHDLISARRVSSFDSASSLSLGPALVSKNGATLVYDAGTSIGGGNYASLEMWAAPVDGSAAPRRITRDLQVGETVRGRSLISPDGRWIVYGITASGVETLFLADLRAGGSSTQIPLPAGATRIESDFNGLVFGPTSQFVYYSATFGSGSQQGMAAYRFPVSNPTAPPVRLSLPAAAGRFAGVISIAQDESRIVQSSFANGAWVLERVETAQPGVITTLESLAAGQSLTNCLTNDALTRVACVVVTEPTPGTFAYALHAAHVATAASGVHIANIPTISMPPIVSRMHPSGDAVLYFTNNNDPLAELDEIQLSPGATPLRMAVGTPDPIAEYIGKNSELVAYKGISGLVQQQERGEQFNFRTIGTRLSSVHAYSPDTNVLALIGAPLAPGENQLHLTNRSFYADVSLTGLVDPGSFTYLIGLVPRE
jgi:hypothetical protein